MAGSVRKARKNPIFKRMAVIGVGLIGGSLSLALKQRGLVGDVVGYGRDPENMRTAKKRGLIDHASQSLGEAVRGADLVVLASPVGAVSWLARSAAPYLKAGAVVTDVGSVKHPIVVEMERIFPKGVFFVPGHPIAGTEHWGAKAAFATLFEGQRCILTPTSKTDPKALQRVIQLWKGVGSKVELMDARLHDRVLGVVSHLPHMIAYALVNSVSEMKGEGTKSGRQSLDLLSYCGGGFRDFTRIASSRPEMWRDICLMNRVEILRGIQIFEKRLRRLRSMIEESDGEGLDHEFLKANRVRARMFS